MLNQFDNIKRIIGNNPIFQFAQKAARPNSVSLTKGSSRTAQGAGYGQEFGIPSNVAHQRQVERQRTFLNMMKFQFNQRGM